MDAKAIDFHSRPLSDLKEKKKEKKNTVQLLSFVIFILNYKRVTNSAEICCSASSFRFQSSGSDHIFVAQ